MSSLLVACAASPKDGGSRPVRLVGFQVGAGLLLPGVIRCGATGYGRAHAGRQHDQGEGEGSTPESRATALPRLFFHLSFLPPSLVSSELRNGIRHPLGCPMPSDANLLRSRPSSHLGAGVRKRSRLGGSMVGHPPTWAQASASQATPPALSHTPLVAGTSRATPGGYPVPSRVACGQKKTPCTLRVLGMPGTGREAGKRTGRSQNPGPAIHCTRERMIHATPAKVNLHGGSRV
jgi:hypothetical protein